MAWQKINMVLTPIIKTEEQPYNSNFSFIGKGPNNEKIEFVEGWKV